MTFIRSKKRVAAHGEVFTPPWMVDAMLDLVKDETNRIDSRVLEPACGSGNFLVRVLQRKLAAVEVKFGKSEFEKKHYALFGLMCIYGIELLEDNIAECRANLIEIMAEYLRTDDADDFYRAASAVLSCNLVHGPCTVQTIWDGEPTGPAVARYLDAYDVLVRRNEAVPILDKIRAKNEPTLEHRVSSRKPFGLATNFKGKPSAAGLKEPVKLFENQRTGWIEGKAITVNPTWIDRWKVLMTAVQGTSAAIETKFLSKPIVAEPGTACTETYIVAGHFDDERAATRYANYLRTRFVRFLVSLRKATQHATRDVYSFVPDLPLDQGWTEDKLYARYGLNETEIAFIESQVAPHDGELFDDVAGNEGDDE